MNSTANTYLSGQPHDYYCIVGRKTSQSCVELPSFVTNGDQMFVTDPLRIYSSENLARRSCNRGEEPLYLICLACFLNIVRSRLGLKRAILDDSHKCDVVAWRAPCQTTAILQDKGQTFYIEGCRESGVFWKPIIEKPETSPPFLKCGAQNIDCLWFECPNGWKFMDDIPVTICKTIEKVSIEKIQTSCLVRFDAPGFELFYAGISKEGFDFTKNKSQAIRLNGVEAKRVATAIANVQINWSGGMMSSQKECRVVVADEEGNELVSIQ